MLRDIFTFTVFSLWSVLLCKIHVVKIVIFKLEYFVKHILRLIAFQKISLGRILFGNDCEVLRIRQFDRKIAFIAFCVIVFLSLFQNFTRISTALTVIVIAVALIEATPIDRSSSRRQI